MAQFFLCIAKKNRAFSVFKQVKAAPADAGTALRIKVFGKGAGKYFFQKVFPRKISEQTQKKRTVRKDRAF